MRRAYFRAPAKVPIKNSCEHVKTDREIGEISRQVTAKLFEEQPVRQEKIAR